MQKSNFLSIKQLVISAVCVALATVLSMLKIYEFPFGGSITAFSMLFICLPGIIYGLPIGLLSGLVYGIVQFILGPYILNPIQVIVDYGLAFAALGLSGIFHTNKNSFTLGYIVGIIGRYIFAVISGYVFFAEYAWSGWGALPYSLCYNGAYIFTEGVLTIIILNIPPIKKSLNTLKMQILN
jgi:hypothetical protein